MKISLFGLKIDVKDKKKWLSIWGFYAYTNKIRRAGWLKVGPLLLRVSVKKGRM